MDVPDNAFDDKYDKISEIVTEDQLFERYGIKKDVVPPQEQIKSFLKDAFQCSASKSFSILTTLLPILKWVPKYSIKRNLIGDITGGLTVGVVHLPQAMAYGLLSGLPPVTGLYVSFFPVLAYVLFGTSRHISVGTFAVVSLMVASVLDPYVPFKCEDTSAASTTSPLNFTTAASVVEDCKVEYDRRKIEAAVSLSVCVAIIMLSILSLATACVGQPLLTFWSHTEQSWMFALIVAALKFIMYILRLGIVTVYLSSHMISGFTCGASFHVLTSQIPKLVGIDVPRKSGPLALIYTYIDLFSKITTINWATVIVSLCCIVVLVIGKEINERWKKKLPFPLPWELAVVIFSDLASYFAYLNINYHVSTVGDVPTGIKTTIPNGSDIGNLMVGAIPIALVTYSVGISLSRMFAVKHGYRINSNQELLAYSIFNLFGAFFSCYPTATSLSRTVIWEETGGKTQVTGIVSSIVILIILLWIGPLFQFLPQAALASIIVVNLKRLLRQFEMLPALFKVSKLDCSVWCITWLAVFLLGVDLGLYIGIGYSLLTAIIRTQTASGEVMIPVSKEKIYRSSKKYDRESKEALPSVLIFSFPSPLYFATQQRFQGQLTNVLGFEPAFAATYAKKQKKKEMKRAMINEAFAKEEEARGDFQEGNDSANTSSETSSTDITNAEAALQYLIVDMEACPFIDNDGVNCIKTLYSDLKELNITLLLAHCQDIVRRYLTSGGFPPSDQDSLPASVFFIDVGRAVHYVQKQTTLSRSCTANVESSLTSRL